MYISIGALNTVIPTVGDTFPTTFFNGFKFDGRTPLFPC